MKSGVAAGLCVLFPSLIALALWCRWYWRRAAVGSATSLPRPRQGQHTNRPRQNSKVEFMIPDAVVGYVIGRRGNRIRQIEEETGAKVRFKERMGTGDKVVAITGLAECVENAESAIRSVVKEKLSQTSEQKESRVLIAGGDVGRLIGRRGTNIRSIQRQSGANVSIEERGKGGGDRLCLVTGTSKQVEEALLLIEETIQPDRGRGKGGHMERQHEGDRPLTLIPAHLPQTKDYVAVFVSAIDCEGGVWVQPIEQQEPALLENLVQNMTSLYSGLSLQEATQESIGIGSVCAAPFEHDERWYRAIVTALPTSDTASLLYIDYGDSGTLPRANLKVLRPEFWSLQCQAVRCVLDSVVAIADSWSEEALTILEQLTHSASWKAVMLRVVVQAQHSVTIIDTNTDQDINVAEQMVDRGFAKWVEHVAEPHPPFSLSHHHLKAGEDIEGRNGSSVDHVILPDGHFPAFVMAVYSLNLFYIMPSFSQRDLAELTKRLNAIYGAGDIVNSSAETVNETSGVVSGVVAVYVREAEQWCRSIVVNSSPDDLSQVKVQLIDYGVLMSLPQSNVQPLKEEFCGPCFAVPCSLADVSAPGNKEEVVNVRTIEIMATQLAQWTKAGRWENTVLVEASPHSDGWRRKVMLFMPGERSSINYQLRKRAQLDNCEEEEGQENGQATQQPTNSTPLQCKIECKIK